MPLPLVHIHYLRPPDRRDVFIQWLLDDRPDVKVTFAPGVPFPRPLVIHGEIAADRGSDILWFTFPDCWHDLGLFHRPNGSVTGLYANILTPPVFEGGGRWRTTDLFLDLWLPPGGELSVLDEDEFEEAVARGWVDEATRRQALEEVERVRAAWTAGAWPPPVAQEWTRERARAALSAAGIDPERPATRADRGGVSA